MLHLHKMHVLFLAIVTKNEADAGKVVGPVKIRHTRISMIAQESRHKFTKESLRRLT